MSVCGGGGGAGGSNRFFIFMYDIMIEQRDIITRSFRAATESPFSLL